MKSNNGLSMDLSAFSKSMVMQHCANTNNTKSLWGFFVTLKLYANY